jgi:hypothetical protein
MESQSSIVKMSDIDFYVDVQREEFRQVDNAKNTIPFSAIEESGNDLVLFFDKTTKNAFPHDQLMWDQENIERINLSGCELLTKPVSSRPLPIVTVYNTAFHIDVRQEEFREAGRPFNRIAFAELNETSNGHNTFFFDTKTKNVFRGTSEELALRKDVQFIKLPSIWKLDPQGMNQLTQELAASVRANREAKDQEADETGLKKITQKKRGPKI